MPRRLALAALLAAAFTAAFVATKARPVDVDAPARPTARRPATDVRPAVTRAEAEPSTRPARVRQSAVAGVRPDGLVAAWIAGAMAKDGDSDPRLLDALAAIGLRPTALMGPAVTVDPWLGAALVDLERQVADRCEACGWDPAEAAAALADEVDDEALGCVVGHLALGEEGGCS